MGQLRSLSKQKSNIDPQSDFNALNRIQKNHSEPLVEDIQVHGLLKC